MNETELYGEATRDAGVNETELYGEVTCDAVKRSFTAKLLATPV